MSDDGGTARPRRLAGLGRAALVNCVCAGVRLDGPLTIEIDRSFVREIGSDARDRAQGFLLCRPLPPADFESVLERGYLGPRRPQPGPGPPTVARQ